MDFESIDQQAEWRVVIVGGGFAGLRCALELASHDNIRITLIDKNNYQQFHPLLYQIAASILSPNNAAFALRDMLRDHDNVDVQMDEVTSIDPEQRTVQTAAGKSFTGDFLVLATGSRVNFFGVPGADKFTFPLYSLTDAEKLRSAILESFEAADRNPSDATTGSLNFVVVGGRHPQ
jgi:NADH:ubiquinone reductase (H+-translocating)